MDDKLIIYHVTSINLNVKEDEVDLGYFKNYEEAKDFALNDIESKNGRNIIWIKKEDKIANSIDLNYTKMSYDCGYLYQSHYGNYTCARRIQEIMVK